MVTKLLRSYDSDDVVSADECEVARCVQGDLMTEAELEKALWKRPFVVGACYLKPR